MEDQVGSYIGISKNQPPPSPCLLATLPPSSSTPANLLTSSIHSRGGAPQFANASQDVTMDSALTTLTGPQTNSPRNSILGLDNNTLVFLVRLMEEEAKQKRQLQLIIKHLRKL
ncbi:hypothetical protein PCANC_18721 [Puccinia coronata f. sp. avenae]|uniref:Uncharacterized protein n=1 Tax=Puccinia coronata f. sp. avenae TaxID=200324 RepID=A0A2N5UAS3_9BASI|nr:hypothetical protein PCANC_18721 [Puccinia coronata f. sp. avenae]